MAGDHIDELKRRVEEQCRRLSVLAESLDGEDEIGQLLRRVEDRCEALSSLAGDFSGGVLF
jgi:hypothetical protein